MMHIVIGSENKKIKVKNWKQAEDKFDIKLMLANKFYKEFTNLFIMIQLMKKRERLGVFHGAKEVKGEPAFPKKVVFD